MGVANRPNINVRSLQLGMRGGASREYNSIIVAIEDQTELFNR